MRHSLDDFIRRFARFLDASWNSAWSAATPMEDIDPADLMADWAQANWELLVETPLRETAGFGEAYLEPYGEGAECNGASSRVWRPQALPTHRVVCRGRETAATMDLLTSRNVDATSHPIVFDHFASLSKRGWHEEAPPFDCVLGYHGNQEILVRVDAILFDLERIDETGL
jgi:hypothetical protein